MSTPRTFHRALRITSAVAAAGLIATLGACSNGSASGTSGDSSGGKITTISVWDPYPQYDDTSDWAKYLQSCAPSGTTIKRTTAATSDVLNNLTTAVKEDNAPDVVLLDNPSVPDAATSGLLAPAKDVGINTDGFDQNLAGPGSVDGVTYGVPIGVNTLGLYYNADILAKAGVDPASITDWASLNAALDKVTKAGSKGITFAGISGEEGVFQFLPWLWGAGADLKSPGSAEAQAAGELVSSWIGKGYAPKSVINDNQSAAWDQFLTGQFGFAVNGSWFAQAASTQNFKAAMIPIPGQNGGTAPVPTGGEFVLAPVHKDNAKGHYDAAKQVVDCLVGPDNQVKTADALGYFSASKDLRQKQIDANAIWKPWAAAIESAAGRTTDLGAAYTQTSAALSTALQTSLNASGDKSAVEQAFKQAATDAQG